LIFALPEASLTLFSLSSSLLLAATKASEGYVTAKSLLNTNMEETLNMVEGLLKSSIELSSNDPLHPTLGPLYYLYGTALLYVVEESTETAGMMGPEDQQEVRREGMANDNDATF